jgi:hypothetical protein
MIDYQDLIGGTDHRPAYAALWNDAPAERSGGHSVTSGAMPHQPLGSGGTPMLDVRIRLQN